MARVAKKVEPKKFIPPFIPLSRPEVTQITGMSRSMIYSLLDANSKSHDPSFPRPLKFGAMKVMWRGDEIEQWMLTRERTTSIGEDEGHNVICTPEKTPEIAPCETNTIKNQ